MLSAIRKRLSYANVAVTLALVFAMTGGAYAANHFLITSTKQISPKVLKALKGKPGANGANGAQGPAGPAGATGPGGPQGPAGATGKEGAAGKEGPQGEPGKEGKPGTTGFTKTLPKGETESGAWAIEAHLPGTGPIEGSAATAISFNIPLAAAAKRIYVKEKEATPAGCTGNVKEPGAAEGNLCVFTAEEVNTNGFPAHICPASASLAECAFGVVEEATDPSGALVTVADKEAGFVASSGTWAVTAE
jgi:Collagen triple helix repeat (20 copies)